jgi:hypothetical protein
MNKIGHRLHLTSTRSTKKLVVRCEIWDSVQRTLIPLSSMSVPMVAAIRIPWAGPRIVPRIIPWRIPRKVPGVIKVRVIGPGVFVFLRPEIDFLGLNDRIYIATTAQRFLSRSFNLSSNSNCAVLTIDLRVEKLIGPHQKASFGQIG